MLGSREGLNNEESNQTVESWAFTLTEFSEFHCRPLKWIYDLEQKKKKKSDHQQVTAHKAHKIYILKLRLHPLFSAENTQVDAI